MEYEVIKDDFIKAGEASSKIKKVLKRLGVDPSVIRRVAIATYEAEMNIVIHSEGGNIEVVVDPERIQVIAKDQGPGIEDVHLAMREGYSTAPHRVRELGFGAGMGLPNIKRCSDEFSIESIVGSFTEVKIIIYQISKQSAQ
ncbi:putative anti-sigma regulatory factor, serine/threonine protein kinase [Alkaliphilus metalliredigens QYMF]|uniref:Putative anti-sigma regulatory factor, serine/threonine protein kinase n=1 Tax=Alkaliphilus metalliredigens (strain QYMF) TaxID=293826 RepID=A6TQG5_ALKMQ|nr:putative anti-sigma regulatory factor, serine/threonine protein kinase [Alkaliphilus metalliredigens QYMF]